MKIWFLTLGLMTTACSDSGNKDTTTDDPQNSNGDTTEESSESTQEEEEEEAPDWSGVWMVSMNLNYACYQDFVDSPRADEDNDQQTIMLQLSGPSDDLYAVTPGTDSSWSMSGAGDENGLFLGGSLRFEVDGEPIDYDSNITINAQDVISAGEVHGTIFGSFSANSGWWECEFKDEPSTVILTQ
ncbi:MAG: hypothetical protein VX278_14330 [Myxococcota bacterium]|nr:hypothetical protein [Myxococcota bacterium]